MGNPSAEIRHITTTWPKLNLSVIVGGDIRIYLRTKYASHTAGGSVLSADKGPFLDTLSPGSRLQKRADWSTRLLTRPPEVTSRVASRTRKISYRSDVDGLRALAVLSVLAFHAYPGAVPGGFVGVDVFFVISGYLISSILISDLQIGRFSFTNFYAGRVRRIFPALILVLALCLIAGWFILSSEEYAKLGKHVAGGAAFLANFIFLDEVGYFDTAASTKPVLHLWSLGVEEQFYLVWPALLWTGWRLRVNFLLLIIIFGLSSFWLAVSADAQHQALAFYSPQDRLWELLMGAMLAYFAVNPRGSDRWKQLSSNQYVTGLVSTLGLGLIISAAIVVRQNNFPGWQALLPTTGVLLLVGAGPNAFWNRYLLSTKLLVAIGLISYPLYLWHWPLLSFSRILGVENDAVSASLLALSVILAGATYWAIERPLRYKLPGRLTAASLLASMILVGLLGYWTCLASGIPSRSIAVLAESQISGSQAVFDYMDKQFYPCELTFVAIEMKSAVSRAGDSVRCRQSRPGTHYDIAIVGDSHGEHLFAGLAGSLSDKNIFYYEKGFLPFTYNRQFAEIYKYLVEDKNIKTVILGISSEKADERELRDWYSDYAELPPGSSFARELASTITLLQENGKDVLIPDDVPLFGFSPAKCLKRWFGEVTLLEEVCREPVREIDKRKAAWTAALLEVTATHPATRILKIERYFCDSKDCSMVHARKLLFFDSTHLNLYGSEYLAVQLLKDYASDLH